MKNTWFKCTKINLPESSPQVPAISLMQIQSTQVAPSITAVPFFIQSTSVLQTNWIISHVNRIFKNHLIGIRKRLLWSNKDIPASAGHSVPDISWKQWQSQPLHSHLSPSFGTQSAWTRHSKNKKEVFNPRNKISRPNLF